MQRASFAKMECPIARAIDVVGEGWILLVLREAFKGARTFADFQSRLGIAPNTLARRLSLLCEQGLLERERYQEHPPRDEYELTAKGLDLLPVLLALATWGNRWLAPNGAPIVPIDRVTGLRIDPVLVDERTAKPIRPGAVALGAGPGASKSLRAALREPLVLGASARSKRQS